MNVTEAEKVVASLEQKRIKCVARGYAVSDLRHLAGLTRKPPTR
jgi:hypothetical protein